MADWGVLQMQQSHDWINASIQHRLHA